MQFEKQNNIVLVTERWNALDAAVLFEGFRIQRVSCLAVDQIAVNWFAKFFRVVSLGINFLPPDGSMVDSFWNPTG